MYHSIQTRLKYIQYYRVARYFIIRTSLSDRLFQNDITLSENFYGWQKEQYTYRAQAVFVFSQNLGSSEWLDIVLTAANKDSTHNV